MQRKKVISALSAKQQIVQLHKLHFLQKNENQERKKV